MIASAAVALLLILCALILLLSNLIGEATHISFFSGYTRFVLGLGFLGVSLGLIKPLVQEITHSPGTTFEHADLTGANFSGAMIDRCNFSNTNITAVNWTGSQIIHTDLPRSGYQSSSHYVP